VKQLIHEEKTQTTCVLRLFGAPLWTVQQAAQQADIAARCRGRGAEVLAALQAETPARLEKARKALNGRFAAELYGEGEMTLVHAAVQALETHRRLLVCCDADAGTLLEARLETVPGAEKVFDFGALSYADAKIREKLSARTCRVKGGPIPAKLARVQAAQRFVGADFAAGCVERAEDTVLFLGSRRGCWVRTVANTDAPALWLLDMIRRAASGLPQAAGTSWQKYGRAVPADVLTAQTLPDKPENTAPAKPPRKRHRVRNALIFLLILTLAAFAAAWYYTGGDLTALPQRLQSLGADSLPHAGAKLI
jgi:competence-damaged protein